MKRVKRTICAAAAAAMIGSGLPEAVADQGVAAGAGNTATANLNFRVVIPPVTRLRIGDPAPAAVTQIEFNLGAVGAPVPGDGVDVDNTNGGSGGYPTNTTTAVTVTLFTTAANVEVDQAPASPTLLGSVLGNTIPWTEILITDSGAGFTHSQTGGPLSNVPTTIFTGGPGTFNGTWTFTYDNAAAYPSDSYDGTMSYTVTNP